ncbi:unnamed protein product, partial [marine sediment metagenome]
MAYNFFLLGKGQVILMILISAGKAFSALIYEKLGGSKVGVF